MIQQLLKQYVTVADGVANWEDAIRLAAKPLRLDGCVSEAYVNAMIQNVHRNGPYIVIMPGVALPHSRVEDGANTTCLSLLKLHQAVMFPEDHAIKLVIALAAKDNDTHMNLLSGLVDILTDEEQMKRILNCASKQELLEILA